MYTCMCHNILTLDKLMHHVRFCYTQHDALILVVLVISYIHHMVEAAILTSKFDLHIALCIFLWQIS